MKIDISFGVPPRILLTFFERQYFREFRCKQIAIIVEPDRLQRFDVRDELTQPLFHSLILPIVSTRNRERCESVTDQDSFLVMLCISARVRASSKVFTSPRS